MYLKKRDKQLQVSNLHLHFAYASRNLVEFTKVVDESIEFTPFHDTYYDLLNNFAQGKIKRMIVSVPPQHGKSMGSSRLLPAFLLGQNPDLKIVIASYSFALARKFGQGVQQVILDSRYAKIFPDTKIKGMGKTDPTAIKTADEFDCIGYCGGLRLVGRETSLTGNRVDVMIMDDLYKDAQEANSPIVRENVWDWYTSVVRTRMHNDSSELIVFTRWHEDDLVGRIQQGEQVYDIKSINDLNDIDSRAWIRVNFEAIKDSPSTPLDPRQMGVPLWPSRHSLELLIEKRDLDPKVFEALYQGHPSSAEGLMYKTFKTYSKIESPVVKKANYTDPADSGSDFLCSICYNVCADGAIYVTDVIYTREPMEITEPMVAKMIVDNCVDVAIIEANNGGKGFSRAVARLVAQNCKRGKTPRIFTKMQRKNKEARIVSNAANVNRYVVMPFDWESKWKKFATDLKNFLSVFAANIHDDAPDSVTAIVEIETNDDNKIEVVTFKSNY